jgi:tetratricopeptide (TPR) repeat protein
MTGRRLSPKGFGLLALLLLVFAEAARLASKFLGPQGGWIVFGLLTAALLTCCAIVWRARKRFAQLSHTSAQSVDAGQFSDALRASDEAIAIAQKWKFRPDDLLASVFLMRSQLLQKSGKHDEALAAAAQALACFCGVKLASTQLGILDHTGALLLEMGQERRAIPLLEAALGFGKQLDRDPFRTSGRLERLGLCYARVGVHANAVSAFAKVVEIMTEQKGPDALHLAGPLVNLGNSYKRIQKLEDAERCYREALRIRQSNPVENSEQLSIVMLNLGVACAESGRYEEAEKYYHQVVEMRIQTLGRNHWRVGNTYNNLANCRRRVRDFKGAEEYIQKAIEILEVRPVSLSNAMESLSRIREDEGRMEEALAATVRAREIQQGLTTPDLSEMAALYDREAHLSERCGDEDRAKDCRSRAAQIRQALAAAPPADRDLTNLPASLQALEQHLASSLERVKALQTAM